MKKRTVALLMAVVLVVGAGIGGTLAWLLDKTDPIVNTFTVGDIDIELTETANTDKDNNGTPDVWEGKMVPNATISKNPNVAVKSDSEACYLFVKLEEKNNGENQKFFTYTVNENTLDPAGPWTAVPGVAGVYYINVDAAAAKAGVNYDVLLNNQVKIKDSVTKKDMVAFKNDDGTIKTDALPTLTVTAYACQSANLSDVNEDGKIDVLDAWKLASTSAA